MRKNSVGPYPLGYPTHYNSSCHSMTTLHLHGVRHPSCWQAYQRFGRLCASAMVFHPPTKVPTCSRERSLGSDHGPASETTPTANRRPKTADRGRRHEVSGTGKRDTEFHRMRPYGIILGKATSADIPLHLGSTASSSTKATKASKASEAAKATQAASRSTEVFEDSEAAKVTEAVILVSEEV